MGGERCVYIYMYVSLKFNRKRVQRIVQLKERKFGLSLNRSVSKKAVR